MWHVKPAGQAACVKRHVQLLTDHKPILGLIFPAALSAREVLALILQELARHAEATHAQLCDSQGKAHIITPDPSFFKRFLLARKIR